VRPSGKQGRKVKSGLIPILPYLTRKKPNHVLDLVTPGKNVPEAFNVIIEIPMNADPDQVRGGQGTGAIFVDRFMSTAMHYPTNYGYVPKTISGDGDPVDVLVITPVPLIPGVVVPAARSAS
jgi:inorganic pyrophosphatase